MKVQDKKGVAAEVKGAGRLLDRVVWALVGALIGFTVNLGMNYLVTQITTGTFSGLVLDNSSKDAIPSAFLELGDKFFTKSDSNGKFQIEKVPNGKYHLQITKAGYKIKELDIQLGGDYGQRIGLEKDIPVVAILTPKSDESVDQVLNITGQANNLPMDRFLWILARPQNTNGYWPQGSALAINPQDGTWNSTIYVGTEGTKDSGKKFQILVVLCSSEANTIFQNYLVEQKKTGRYPPVDLPKDSLVMAQMNVVRN